MKVDLHIDRGQSTVSDGAADGTSEGEAGVELKAAHLLGSRGDLLGDLLDGSGGVGRHYYDTISILYSSKTNRKKRWTRKRGEGEESVGMRQHEAIEEERKMTEGEKRDRI